MTLVRERTVFISYCHRDETWKERLVTHLQVLGRQTALEIWDDRRVGAGESWRAEIDAALRRAQVAVLLISADFLTSDFILSEEVPSILERRESEGLCVIPVLVKPCDWSAIEWLAAIQARPRDGRPLSAGSEHEIDSDLAALASEIRELLSPAEAPPASGEAGADPKLRRWDPPPYPADPYPLLLPYDHPELLAGPKRELAELRRMLAKPIPILGLFAPSGAGKSSLLNAGLVPGLRKDGWAVALDRHPHEAGLAERLIAHLLVLAGNERRKVGDDPRVFVESLQAAKELAGEPALLVLDQFEDVLLHKAARARVGVLLAATVREQLAGEAPLCRWLLAYRQEFHGGVKTWLEDVLLEARKAEIEVASLPFDLSSPDRFHVWRLALLGSPPPGQDEATVPLAAFRAAIEAPLTLETEDGSRRYPWRFQGDGAERLARAFAEARLDAREAPLAPELQVVLAHLLAQAGPAVGTVGESRIREIEVPADPDRLIADALADHLRKVLREAFSAGSKAGTRRRTRALLALR